MPMNRADRAARLNRNRPIPRSEGIREGLGGYRRWGSSNDDAVQARVREGYRGIAAQR